jgi:hypothetical protein
MANVPINTGNMANLMAYRGDGNSGAGYEVMHVVGTPSGNVDFTLTLDTNVYASGDVLAATQAAADVFRLAGVTATLQSIILNDKDDQGGALDLVFLRSNVSIGTENAAVSITDANADEIIGIVSIETGDWKDLGGCRVATICDSRVGFLLNATSGTSLYLAAISRDAKTYSANGITGHLGLVRD